MSFEELDILIRREITNGDVLHDTLLVKEDLEKDFQNADCGLLASYIDVYIEALEKQVPQTVEHNETELACPRCNRIFDIDEIEMPYCWHCGQKLNWYWSDEE